MSYDDYWWDQRYDAARYATHPEEYVSEDSAYAEREDAVMTDGRTQAEAELDDGVTWDLDGHRYNYVDE
jgi:hypothetical protein